MRSVRRLNPYTSMCVIVLCGDSKIDDKYSSSSAHDYKWKLINASREVVNDLLDLILFISFFFRKCNLCWTKKTAAKEVNRKERKKKPKKILTTHLRTGMCNSKSAV